MNLDGPKNIALKCDIMINRTERKGKKRKT